MIRRPVAHAVGHEGASQGSRGEVKIYKGQRGPGGTVVTVDDEPLAPRTDLRDFHADGYEWGYEGSGPSQLAFAILADLLGGQGAFGKYRRFVADVIAELKDDQWQMTDEDVHDKLDDSGIVEVDMDLQTLLKKVRGEI